MKPTWTIEPSDIDTVKRFLSGHLDRQFVQDRIKVNLRKDKAKLIYPTGCSKWRWGKLITT